MLKDIIAVEPLDRFRLNLRFEDGAQGIVDVSRLVKFNGVFSSLVDPKEFAAVQVNPDLGTIVWPCGADLDPDVLSAIATGQPIPNCEAAAKSK